MKIFSLFLLVLTHALYGQTFDYEFSVENFSVSNIAFSKDGNYLLVSNDSYLKIYPFPPKLPLKRKLETIPEDGEWSLQERPTFEQILKRTPNKDEWWFQDPTFDQNTDHYIFTIDLFYFHVFDPLLKDVCSGKFPSDFFASKGGGVSSSLVYAYTLGTYDREYYNFILWKKVDDCYEILQQKTGVTFAQFSGNLLWIKRRPHSEYSLDEFWAMGEPDITIAGEVIMEKETHLPQQNTEIMEVHHPTLRVSARLVPLPIYKTRIEIWQD